MGRAKRSGRIEFSSKTRRLIWDRANGQCEKCSAPVDLGRFEYDHIDPSYFSGCNEVSNGQLLCLVCHDEKTKKDIKDIAKSKRIVAKRIKAKKPRGRPIMGSKRSGYRKRMSGRVERW